MILAETAVLNETTGAPFILRATTRTRRRCLVVVGGYGASFDTIMRSAGFELYAIDRFSNEWWYHPKVRRLTRNQMANDVWNDWDRDEDGRFRE